MRKLQMKLVISDIDGTILDDEHQLDNQLKNNLKLLREESIQFILASARSPRGMYALAEKLGIKNNPIVCYNGALILESADETDYKKIVSHEMNSDDTMILLDIIGDKYPEIAINLYSGKDWYVDKKSEWIEIEKNITRETPILKNLRLLLSENQVPIHKLLFIGNAEEIQEVLEFSKTLKLDDCSFYLSKDNYLEVMNKKGSKASALLEISKYYGVELKNTMAIGDNFNDIPMLLLSGLGVSMANAPREVQEKADTVTLGNNNNGVSVALSKYVLNQ